MKATLLSFVVIGALADGCSSHAPQANKNAAEAAITAAPVALITGRDTASTGALIALDGKGSKGDFVAWHVDLSGVTRPNGEDAARLREAAADLTRLGYQVTSPQGSDVFYAVRDKELFLASYTGVYRVTLAVSNAAGVDIDGHIVTVGQTPKPPTGDGPGTPVPVPGYGLAEKVPGWLASVPKSEAATQALLKKTLGDIALLAESGDLRTIGEMNTASAAAIKAVVSNPLPWAAFGIGFVSELAQLTKSGKITSVEQYAAAFREIAGAM